MLNSINPYNGQEIFKIQEWDWESVVTGLHQANATQKSWSGLPIKHRCSLLLILAKILRNKKEVLANTITLEVGKPITQSLAEIEKCAWLCEYYATAAEGQLKIENVATDAKRSAIRYDPLGVILGVMPWNYPFWQVFRFAIPTLTAGNGAVLKHASNVSKSGVLIEALFHEAGYPKGIFQFFPIRNTLVNKIIEHPIVRGVSLTGSLPAGAAVGSCAGRVIKKSVLELGGNNALVVFEDADIRQSVVSCVHARFQNTGQSCIAGKRLLLHKAIADEFLKLLIHEVKNLKSGDPMDKNTYVGVMAREDLAKELEQQMLSSIKKGANLLLGGKRSGAYFEPTILSNVVPGMSVFDEETFGPLLAVSTFNSDSQAEELISNSDFGLGVSIFTRSEVRINHFISVLNEGAIFINDLVKSDPRLPFGGVKQSGYGRELAAAGIREFVNIKTIYQS
ncbi:MAG: hypothetical protein RLZZ241_339 [Bacteroidota bacterium]